MNATDPIPAEQLRGRILRQTSRSFYLSIRLLPPALRDPIALAYLLARATDTLADTAMIDAALRATELERLAGLIQDGVPNESSDSFAAFALLQENASERALIQALPQCLAWLATLPAADQADVRAVLASINVGQILDVERFGNPGAVTALETAEELERYTWLVAGCVGEFWTRICFRHLPAFSRRPEEEMLSLGKKFGQGLQLINILRDAGADLRAGRCYLPRTELANAYLTPAELQKNPAAAAPILEAWQARATAGIAAGLEYACAIQPWRVRLATALPALLGARTLALLRAAGTEAFARPVKMPRAEVRQILWKTALALAAPATLRKLFARLSS